jgi:hypothetical protein
MHPTMKLTIAVLAVTLAGCVAPPARRPAPPLPQAAPVPLHDDARAGVEADRQAQAAAREKATRERETKQKYDLYRAAYDTMRSPDDARSFVDRYSGTYDPDQLVAGAMKKGYQAGIAEAKRCIEYSNRQIANQKEVGNTVGYVDKNATYLAGANLVRCRRQLDEYQAKAPR